MNRTSISEPLGADSNVIALNRLRAEVGRQRPRLREHRSGTGLYLTVFNFDGVLADSLQHYRQTLQVAARVAGLPAGALPADLLIQAEQLDAATLATALDVPRARRAAFCRQFDAKLVGSAWRCDLYPGVAQMLGTLCANGYTAVLSRSDAAFIESVLSHHGLRHTVHAVIGSDSSGDKEAAMHNLLRRFDVSGERAIYCGDCVRDIHLANRVGMRSAACTWGWQPSLSAQCDTAITASGVGHLLAQLSSPVGLGPDVTC